MAGYTQLGFLEQEKTCSSCGQVKARTEFHRARQNRDGLSGRCKSCVRAYNDRWRIENADHVKAWQRDYLNRPGVRERKADQLRKWKEANADRHKRQRKSYYLANRDEILRKDKEYKTRNAEKVRDRRRRYWQTHRERLIAQHKIWYRANRDVLLLRAKQYRILHRDEILQRERDRYHANRESALAAMRAYQARPEVRERSRQRMRRWRDANRDRFLATIKSRKYRLRTASQTADEETNAFLTDIRRDPCSYCGAAGGTVDHIVPLSKGGDHHWSNFAGACLDCNMRKKTMSALVFLYRVNRRSGN